MASQLQTFMHAERIQESGDNYGAYNAGSAAAGAYQFEPPTWRGALTMAGLRGSPYYNQSPRFAPPAVQDAAAAALMGSYYVAYGQSWYNVAEAWYGGGGAVGHPGRGGGPGYPNVGQYAAQVMAIYAALSIGIGGGGAPPVDTSAPDTSGEWTKALRVWQWEEWIYAGGLGTITTSLTASGGIT